jgi:hypothetical protein
MNNNAALRIVYRLLALALVVTGFAQMPIFKRYYVADVPGLGWLADFTLNHALHLGLGAAFLALIAYAAGVWLAEPRGGLSAGGVARVAAVALVAGSGLLRAVMDLSWWTPSQAMLTGADLVHLGSTLGWGGVEVGLLVSRRFGRSRLGSRA